jgi:hypothetical protein
MRSCRTPSDKVVLNPKSRASYSVMLLIAMKSRCTMYLIWSPCRARSTTPTPAPSLREEPSKKRVQCGPVKTGALGSGSLLSGPPGGLADGVHSTMKLASTWLLTAWRDTKSSSNSANSTAHLAILSVTLGHDMQEYYDLRQRLSRRELPINNLVSGLTNGNRRPNPNKMPRAGATQP